jgi:tetratricopeptide (TPR) repeat protein
LLFFYSFSCRLGNEAFAKRDYKVAIECYTKAIQREPKNHIFYSNRRYDNQTTVYKRTNSRFSRFVYYKGTVNERLHKLIFVFFFPVFFFFKYSASHAGLQAWDDSTKDAKECIRLNPEFIKGYYRLATAQLESKSYDAAEATIKQGLGLDANNSQLLKILRSVKLYRKAAAAAASSSNNNSSVATATAPGNTNNRQLDTATTRELHDLQMQYGTTAREYNTVNANLNKAQREEKMYGITLSEVEQSPSASGNYFRSVGKLFLQSTKPEVTEHLQSNIDNQKKTQEELTGKKDYLEKRLKSQQMNMKELSQQQ